jgi:spore germination cell wall hydrolase CwlJ-like protein
MPTTRISYKSFFGSNSGRYVGVESKKLSELKKIDVVVGKFFKLHERQYQTYLRTQQRRKLSAERALGLSEERSSESRSGKLVSGVKSTAKKVADFIGLGAIVKLLIGLAALNWISDPKNKEALLGFVKFLKGLFDIASAVAGFAVNNIIDGLYQIIDGPILSKVFGVLKLIIGLFALRYLFKPWKIISDLKNIWKNRKTIQNVWKAFIDGAKNGLIPAIQGVLKTLPATANLFKHGLKRGLFRAILKVFGKGGFRILSGAAKLAAKAGGKIAGAASGLLNTAAAKTAGKVLGKVPLVGPLITLGINLALGDPLDKAIFKAAATGVGQAAGGWIGGIIGTAAGSVVPVIGNILAGGAGAAIGSVVGGLLGDFIGDKTYDFFKRGSDVAKEPPKLAAGGIVTRETKAIIGEAGPEAVVPLKEFGSEGIVGSKLIEPFKIVGSAILGTMFKVVTSFGPLGVAIIPLLKTVLGPSIKIFGMDSIATSGIAMNRGSGSVNIPKIKIKKDDKKDKQLIGEEKVNVLRAEKDSEGKKAQYKARRNKGMSMRALLADILNNVIQLDTSKKKGKKGKGGPGGSPTGDVGELGGEVDLSSADDQTLLKQLALAEAAGEGKIGMALVINSVLNRKRILDSGKSPGFFGANDKTIKGIIYGGNGAQYQPVRNGSINKQWGEGSLKLAQQALEIGMSPDKLSKELGNHPNKKYLIGATGFRAGSAFEDPSQNVNVTKHGNHYFNTAGNNKMQTGGIVQSAKKAVSEGKQGPAKPPCASWVRMVLGMAGHPAANKVTKKGDLDPEKQSWGPNMAASFAGSDMGTVIRSKSALKAGDIVLHKNTFGNYPSGAITHVSIASEKPGNIYHQSTTGGAPKEGSIWNFAAGIRLGGSGSIGTSSDDTSSGSNGTTTPSETETSSSETIDWTKITGYFKDLTGALRGAPELPAAGTGPKVSGMTIDEISQVYSKNTKPVTPLNNIVISGGTTQFNSIVTQDFSAFAPPEFSVDSANKFKFTGRL